MKLLRKITPAFLIATLAIFIGCSSDTENKKQRSLAEAKQDTSNRIAIIEGRLSGTEAVRYDKNQDVYFISNFNGSAAKADSNGFIAKATAQGTIDSLRFMTGTNKSPLHSPRGMYITGDTLYVADLNGLHSFNTQTGEQLSYIDLSSFEPGFLNDVAVATNGNIYVTDTGQSRIYKITGGSASIAVDSLEDPPNGITRDPESGQLLIAPWEGGQVFRSFATDDLSPQDFITTSAGGNFDGIEPYKDSFIVASQNDSSLYLIGQDQPSKRIITTAPKPADIAVDTKRNRVAVPYISLNRVDIWKINADKN